MTYETLQTDVNDTQLTVQLDQKESLNAISSKTMAEMHAVLDEFEERDDVHVLVYTGTGNVFSAGANLDEIAATIENDDWGTLMHFLRNGQLLMDRIARLDAPTVAAVNGYALGGGLELAVACDFRFASTEASLGLPEIDIGMIPGWGGTQRLPRLVGPSTAKHILLSGEQLDAEEAREVGLVDRVYADDEFETEVTEYAQMLGEKPPETMPLLLDAVRAGEQNPIESGLTYELMSNMFAGFTADAQDAIAEFAGD